MVDDLGRGFHFTFSILDLSLKDDCNDSSMPNDKSKIENVKY
jgi:hypothetical protein